MKITQDSTQIVESRAPEDPSSSRMEEAATTMAKLVRGQKVNQFVAVEPPVVEEITLTQIPKIHTNRLQMVIQPQVQIASHTETTRSLSALQSNKLLSLTSLCNLQQEAAAVVVHDRRPSQLRPSLGDFQMASRCNLSRPITPCTIT